MPYRSRGYAEGGGGADVSILDAPYLNQPVPGSRLAPPSPGGDAPGIISQVLQQLRGLRSQVQGGQLNMADFLQQSSPLVKQAQSAVENTANRGSDAANSVNPLWQQLQSENFVQSQDGKWQATVPFSEQEFAALPQNVKPTADQINQGLVPATSLPGNIALNTQISQQQQKQQDLSNQAMGKIKSQYDDYSQNALKNLTQQFTTGQPGQDFQNYFNNLGLLDSGAFSQGLANVVGQNQQNIMGQENNYLNSLIGQNYNTLSDLSSGGLQRQFSLQDFYNQSDLQRQLASMQNDSYMNAINQSKQNPWTQIGVGFGSNIPNMFRVGM